MKEQTIICPFCHINFVTENNTIPFHSYEDETFEGWCDGCGIEISEGGTGEKTDERE